MNKRIQNIFIISIVLQLTKLSLVYLQIESFWFTSLILIYLIIAFPLAVIIAIKDINQGLRHNIYNAFGIALTLPVAFFIMFAYKSLFYTSPKIEIEPDSVKVITKDGRELNLDSLKITIEKDSNNIESVKFQEK